MFFWRVPAPNEALLISGSKRRSDDTQFRIVTGHGSIVLPVKQKANQQPRRPACGGSGQPGQDRPGAG